MSFRFRSHIATAAIASFAMAPAALVAQAKDSTAKPAAPAATQLPPIDFSGVIFGNYQYRGDQANKAQNKFDVERAYLTFKMPAGDRASIRVTTDLYQQTSSTNNADGFYKGWVIRAKYAYVNYTFLKNADWKIDGRVGMVHTAVIDPIETFWPRWLSQTAVERAGFFSSSDVGVASFVGLPNKMGEVYLGIANGPGYASRETDRFKDYSARLLLTPLAHNADLGVLKSLTLIGYYYKGELASKFVAGGAGQVAPITSGLTRDRFGFFAGLKDPRFTLAGEFGQRKDGGETGANTVVSPRALIDTTGRLTSAFAIVKPFQLADKNGLPIGIVVRFDHVKPNTSTNPDYNIVIGGLTFDLNKKVSFSLDYQEQTPHNGVSVANSKTYFAHWVANF